MRGFVLYLIPVLALLYSLSLPPVGQHDHSLLLIHLQALGLLKYSSHPPTLPILVRAVYETLGADYQVVRLLAILSASLLPLSALLIGSRLGKGVGLWAYLLALTSPLFLIYGKAPLYALFGFSFGAFALALHTSGRPLLANLISAVALILDWTSIPLVLPVLYDTLKRRRPLLLLYLPTLPIYALWVADFSTVAGGEFSQRLPSPQSLLLLVPVVALRLLLFTGPITLLGILHLSIRRTRLPRFLLRYLYLQLAFVLLWANFYVYHTPYLFNLLPLLAVAGALGVVRMGVRLKASLLTLSIIYSAALTFLLLYPYRTFAASDVGCILLRLSESKAGARYVLPEGGRPPKSLKLLLTLLPPDDSSPITVSFGPKGRRPIVLYGDTVSITGYGTVRCRGDTGRIDRLLLRLKGIK